jgi:alpha,alpha-trehalose phosphorylase
VRSRRLASLADRHLAAIDYEVIALDGDAHVTVSSELVTHAPVQSTDDPRRGKGFASKVLVPRDARAQGDRALLHLATRNSGLELGCGMAHRIDSPADVTVDAHAEGDGARVVVQAELGGGESLRLSKFVAYHWAPHAAAGDLLGPSSARSAARARRATARSKPRTAPRSRRSGGVVTWSSRATRSSSGPCASTCSR